MQKLKFVRAACIASAALLVSVMAYASDQAFSPAAACNWTSSAGFNVGSQGQLTNPSTSTRSAICSVGQDHALDTTDDVRVYYNEVSTTAGYFCGVVVNNYSWSTVFFGDQKWACSTTGGCSAAPANSFTGTGYIQLVNLQHGGDFISNVTCNDPGSSELRSLWLDEQ